MRKLIKRFGHYFIFFLFLVNILSWNVVFDLSRPALLKVVFFDVGQGDAIFIETPKRHQILIDGGSSEDLLLEKISNELPFYDRSIDLIILTHPEKDHLRGLIGILKSYKVNFILITGIERESKDYEFFKKLVEKEKATVLFAKRGEKIISGEVNLIVLYPFENLKGKIFKDTNNTSIVSLLKFNKISFLLTGDIYKKIEKELIEKGDLKAKVLKIPHHGSKNSSSEEFLMAVSPEIAVFSVGKENPYGHPHKEVLEKLEKLGIKILRTDEKGDIKFITDGLLLELKNGKI